MSNQDNKVLVGEIRFLGLGDLFQMLGANASSGLLSLTSPFAPEPGHIYFSKGNIIHSTAMGQESTDALYSLFGWTQGEFTFTEMKPECERTINQGIMEVVMEGARLFDDEQIQELTAETYAGHAGNAPAEPAPPPKKRRSKPRGIPIIRQPISNQTFISGEEIISPGEEILNSGKRGAWLNVILEGFANVFKQCDNGNVRICRLGPGAMVGNIPTFMNYKSYRTMSITAARSVKVGTFNMQNLLSDFAGLSNQLRDLAISLDRRWTEVTSRVAEAHAGTVRLQAFAERKTPFVPGDDDKNKAFKIADGIATIVREVDGGFVPLARLGKGDFIGPVPFMSIGHEPNAGMVLGSTNFELEPIDTEALQEEFDRISPVVKAFLGHMANCVSVTTMVAASAMEPEPLPQAAAN